MIIFTNSKIVKFHTLADRIRNINNFSDDFEANKHVRVVYLLTINGRASRQVKRLIKRLYDGKNYIFLHVDARNDYLYREMKDVESKFPDLIHVTDRRRNIVWGGTSMLRMLLDCYEILLNKKEWKWDFVINLSESDYPLRKTKDFISFLSKNRHKNFLQSVHENGKYIYVSILVLYLIKIPKFKNAYCIKIP